MGVTASHQPPQIMHPAEGASGLPIDACVWEPEARPKRTSVSLVYDGHVLVTFETGDEPGRPSAIPKLRIRDAKLHTVYATAAE